MEILTGTGTATRRCSLSFSDWLPVASPAPWCWDYRHLAVIRRELENVDAGHIDRLAIIVPPRHGKSEQVTVRRPAWKLEHDPTWRTIVGCHTQSLARRFSRKTRRIVRERGLVALDPESQAVDDWETLAGGGLKGVGVGVAVAGAGANEIIIDDPVKSRKDVSSSILREAVFEWYTDDVVTRLAPGGSIILQLTRWHVDDLAGRILASEEGKDWTVVNLPALATDGDPLGRAQGEALCPERYSREALLRLRTILRCNFEALYQGNPTAVEGDILKREWIRRYDPAGGFPEFIQVVQSWDTAQKPDQIQNDPSVCTTWGITRGAWWLLDVWREWVTYPQLKHQVVAQAQRWTPTTVLIEDKSTGSSLIQELHASTTLPVIAVEPVSDKVTRFSAETSAYEAGIVHHPKFADWLQDYEAELVAVPNAAHMDQADSTSQFLAWARHATMRFDIATAGLLRVSGGVDGAAEVDHFVFGGARSGGRATAVGF